MKNPYAPPPRPETDLQHKASKLAAWHEQQAAACDRECSRASSLEAKQQALQQAAWHRETAAAWRALIDVEQPMPVRGSFSARG